MAQVLAYDGRRIVKKEFDVSNIGFRRVIKTGTGWTMVGVDYEGGALTLALPEMRVSFDVAGYSPDGGAVSAPKYSLELEVEDEALRKQLDQIKERCVEYVHAHSVELFGREKSLDLVREGFTPLYRKSLGRDRLPNGFPDRMKVKFQVKRHRETGTEVFPVKMFDEDGRRVFARPDEYIKRGWQVQVAVNCPVLWFSGSVSWGLTMNAQQLLAKTPQDDLGEASVFGGEGTCGVSEECFLEAEE